MSLLTFFDQFNALLYYNSTYLFQEKQHLKRYLTWVKLVSFRTIF